MFYRRARASGHLPLFFLITIQKIIEKKCLQNITSTHYALNDKQQIPDPKLQIMPTAQKSQSWHQTKGQSRIFREHENKKSMNLMNIVSTGHRKGPNFKGYPIIQQNIKGTQHSYPWRTAPTKVQTKTNQYNCNSMHN